MNPDSIKNFTIKKWLNYRILKLRLLKDPELPTPKKGGKTSISDGSTYLLICKETLNNKNVYKNFRRYEAYFDILEHVSKDLGFEYLKIILKADPLLKSFNQSKIQNSIGNPIKYYYRKTGFTSPTLLRYLKVHDELNTLFGPLDNKIITEIGVGYGGQAGVIMLNNQISHYNLFDLEEVNNLASKFLRDIGIYSNFTTFDGRNPSLVKSNLVVSNYAFSELNRNTQNLYLENVILNSETGYLTWNDLGYRNFGALSINEIVERIPNANIIDEQPQSDPSNKIIVWGV